MYYLFYVVYIYVRTFVRTYVCIYVCMYVCMYVYMHACMYVPEGELARAKLMDNLYLLIACFSALLGRSVYNYIYEMSCIITSILVLNTILWN